MALINCRECGKEISDIAPTCPHCGCPQEQKQTLAQSPTQNNPFIPKCFNCNSDLKFIIETIGGSQKKPILHKIGYCNSCNVKFDFGKLADPNQTTKKESSLSIWALILSLFGLTAFIGFILALVDLFRMDENSKHTGSWAALVFSAFYCLMIYIFYRF